MIADKDLRPASYRWPAPGGAGFTLLELLVVLVIFSLISVMAYGGLNSVMKSRAQVEASLERTAQMQKVFQRLREDFQQLRRRPVRDGYGALRASFIGIREPRVEFTRGGWRNPLLSPRAGLERVIYRLEDNELLRESFRVLDQAQDSKPVSVALLDGVSALRLRYLGETREWTDEWPPLTATGEVANAQAAPPLAVEMTLETESDGELVYLFRLGLDVLPKNLVLGQAAQATTGQKPATGDAGGTAPTGAETVPTP